MKKPLPKKEKKHEMEIIYVMELMRKLEFRKGETSRTLETKWNYSHDQVKRICAEASKRVCAEVADPDEVARDVGVALSEGIKLARERGDWKTVGELSRIMANITLARPAAKTETNAQVAITPTMAASAVKEFFSDKVSNDLKSPESPTSPSPEAEPVNGVGEAGGPPN